jgi:putative restriction endonuclease
MKFDVAITNQQWYRDLRPLNPDEVNFWSPGSTAVRLNVGTPMLFKLKGLDVVAGVGFFTHYTRLPVSVAWDDFGEKNGVRSLDDFVKLLGALGPSSLIGCTVLSEPSFWPDDLWLPPPPGWQKNVQRYVAFDTSKPEVARYWEQVAIRLAKPILMEPDSRPAVGKPILYLPRLGQGGFRSEVRDAYNRRCAVTGERTLPALEAAHIVPFSEIKVHDVRNGLFLRSDLHKLFDQGYVTVNANFQFEVSRRIKDGFENGHDYYALQGTRIALPSDPRQLPSREFLESHASRIYRG